MGLLKRTGAWFHDRLGLERILDFVARHPVPRSHVEGRRGWMYVLGSATLAAFVLQVVTGIVLTGAYIPSPEHARESLIYINQQVVLGGFVRALHYFGASAMVVLISLHAIRVFLTGSYKFPREMTWLLGVLLLVLTLLMAGTGQMLRWDQNGISGVALAGQMMARVPLVGEWLARFVLAGDQVGGSTLTRFFSFHVVIFPLLIMLVLALHLYLVMHHGVSEPPRAGDRVDKQSYRASYDAELKRSPYRYWPDAAWRGAVTGAGVVLVVMVLALASGPEGPAEPADPTVATVDHPDWYFRWYYALLSVTPPHVETFIMVYLPLLVGFGLIILPFVASTGERHPRRRPWAVILVLAIVTVFGVLTYRGMQAPWVMRFDAEPVPAAVAAVASDGGDEAGLAAEGALLFNARGCQYCHAVDGNGGTYGPALGNVTQRLPPEMIVARTLNGYGNMPAYRGNLTTREMSAILAFLRSREQP